MKITTPEEFRAARAARIEKDRLAAELRREADESMAKDIVEGFDAMLAAGDDVFDRGDARLYTTGESVAKVVETMLREAGWKAAAACSEDELSANCTPIWSVIVREGGA